MHDLSLYLLELLENSIAAGATQVEIALLLDQASDLLSLTVDDDGAGLSASPEQILDPFYTTKTDKKTGLGLSLLRAEAQGAGGDLTVGSSETMGGTQVRAYLELSHVDRVPLGDVASTISVTAFTNPDVQFRVSLKGDLFVPPLLGATPAAAVERLAKEPAWRQAANT